MENRVSIVLKRGAEMKETKWMKEKKQFKGELYSGEEVNDPDRNRTSRKHREKVSDRTLDYQQMKYQIICANCGYKKDVTNAYLSRLDMRVGMLLKQRSRLTCTKCKKKNVKFLMIPK
jgi:hypothetical protein